MARWWWWYEVGNERQEKEDQIVSKLHNILQPFLLRRLKSDVELKIPPKKELVLYVPLSSSQSDMYASLLNRTLLDNDVPLL